jgi:hypothetical protein
MKQEASEQNVCMYCIACEIQESLSVVRTYMEY